MDRGAGRKRAPLDFFHTRDLIAAMPAALAEKPPEDPRRVVERIVGESGSNLARTLFLVPRERRFAMRVFYAFCRIVDDAADDVSVPAEERRAALLVHRRSVREKTPGESPVAALLREVLAECRARPEDAEAVVDGMLMDLEPEPFPDFPALEHYCHHAASAVGLVSLRIFGCRDDSCDEFARRLGVGLQLVNILRDAGEDYTERGRIYLPEDARQAAGCGLEVFAEAAERARRGEPPPAAMTSLLAAEARRARSYLNGVERLIPPCCAGFLKAPLLMRAVYSRLLDKIERGGFDVFARRYRLARWEKLALLARLFLAGK